MKISASSDQLYMGLMSGTSLDGVDAVIVDFQSSCVKRLGHAFTPFDAIFKAQLLALNAPGHNELHRAHLASNELARLYAKTALDLLQRLCLPPQRIKALGAHGQTIRHQPQAHDEWGYSTQLLSAHLLAELTGIDVVHDFRSRDLFAGGQGAPLVPAFHQHIFSSAQVHRVILNLGGMSNVSILPPLETPVKSPQSEYRVASVAGFDCGPGNVLMDMWCLKHLGKPYDPGGQWAQSGRVHPGLLARCLEEPFFRMPAPKSTGRDLFNDAWLQKQLSGSFDHLPPEDVQATLCALTAQSVLLALEAYFEAQRSRDSSKIDFELVLCGGGAFNATLVNMLEQGANDSPKLGLLRCLGSEDLGCPPQEVEAVAFAWLARQRVLGLAANLPAVTGAQGERILGSWIKAGAVF